MNALQEFDRLRYEWELACERTSATSTRDPNWLEVKWQECAAWARMDLVSRRGIMAITAPSMPCSEEKLYRLHSTDCDFLYGFYSPANSEVIASWLRTATHSIEPSDSETLAREVLKPDAGQVRLGEWTLEVVK